jgi:hypothetical protein
LGHTSFQLDRRAFVRAGLSSAGALALGPAFLERAFATGPVIVGGGPYGRLQPYDANGIALPAGFRSRQIARGGKLVPGTSYPWHFATDGQATFPTLGAGGRPNGGWILVANSEVPLPGGGGVSGIEFAPNGKIKRAYRVLAGTRRGGGRCAARGGGLRDLGSLQQAAGREGQRPIGDRLRVRTRSSATPT